MGHDESEYLEFPLSQKKKHNNSLARAERRFIKCNKTHTNGNSRIIHTF